MITWKDEYCTGIPVVDEQHQYLVDIANQTYDLLTNNLILDKYDRIINILQKLQDYTVYHFKTEEEFMQSVGYKKILSHKVAHSDFLNALEKVDTSRIDVDHDAYLHEILEFVCDWLINHIIKEDKQIPQN